MDFKHYEIIEYDQHGDGTRLWHARWDKDTEIVIYVGTASDDTIMVSRLQKIEVIYARRKMKVQDFHSTVEEFIKNIINTEKVTGVQWNP